MGIDFAEDIESVAYGYNFDHTLYVEGFVNSSVPQQQTEVEIMPEITSRITLGAVKEKYTGNVRKSRQPDVNNACFGLALTCIPAD